MDGLFHGQSQSNMDDLGYWRATLIKSAGNLTGQKKSTAIGCWIKHIVYRDFSCCIDDGFVNIYRY